MFLFVWKFCSALVASWFTNVICDDIKRSEYKIIFNVFFWFQVKEKLESWGFGFSNELASVRGRVLDREKIIFATPRGNEKPEQANDKADWTNAFRSRQMLSVKNLDSWAIIVPQRDRQNLDNLIQTMIKVAKPLNFIIQRPTNM